MDNLNSNLQFKGKEASNASFSAVRHSWVSLA